jgi:hypothetical protein
MNYDENDDNALYHYTTSCAVVNILKTQCFRLSHFARANDPKEIEPALRNNPKIESGKYKIYCQKFFEYYDNNIKYLSLTKDVQYNNYIGVNNDEKQFYHYLCNKGFNRPRMWTQYAEKHSGICICFNKENLLRKFETNNAIIRPYYLDDINYVNYIDYSKVVRTETEFLSEEHIEFIDMITNNDIIDNIFKVEAKMRSHHFEYFFIKLSDWSDEKEKRILAFSHEKSEIGIDISNTIEYIVLGYKCGKNRQVQIKDYCNRLGISVIKINYINGNAQYEII